MKGVLIYLAIYLVMTLGTVRLHPRHAPRRQAGRGHLRAWRASPQTNLPMAFVLAMLMFSLAGVPPLAGFFAKFYVFCAADRRPSSTRCAIIGVLARASSAPTITLRIVKVMFFDEAKPSFNPAAPYVRFVMIAAGLFVVLYAVYPSSARSTPLPPQPNRCSSRP